MQGHISVRIDPETKRKLDRLATYLNINLSDLLRSYIVPLAQATLQIETVKNISSLERTVLRSFVGSKEFQQLLREVKRFLKEEEFCEGCDCDHRITLEVIPRSFLTIKEDEVLWPAFVERVVDGYCQYYYVEKVASLKELAEWLEDLKRAMGVLLGNKIEEVKEAIRKLTS